MLKQLILENRKSFRYAELPLDSFTVLIGANASGKSNVVQTSNIMLSLDIMEFVCIVTSIYDINKI
ncbi:MAG: AAA family ATPase [Nostoc sp.]|uniref:AAA family ATPase n=1 Tax=Nostoc sp. TaxID=1180 RepID=UPI002FF9CBB7